MSYRTIAAAEALLTSSNRDTWSLADAVLADIPERPMTRRSAASREAANESDVLDALADVVSELASAGVATPNGDPYTVPALRMLRQTAMAWPPAERHDEAAYRTHQEAHGDKARTALAGLCAVARHEAVDMPEGLDEVSWYDAVARVQAKLGKRARRFPVAANDVRVAMARRPNTPPHGTTTTELLALISDMGAGARTFTKTLAASEAGLRDDERTVIVEAIEHLIASLNGLVAIVQGVSDADLDALLVEGREP